MSISDEARRISDEVRMNIALGNMYKVLAFRLQDGWTDHTVYDSVRDARKHQLFPERFLYVQIPPDDMPPEHAQRYLEINRLLYEQGFRFTDPDGPEIIIPHNTEDLSFAIRNLKGMR